MGYIRFQDGMGVFEGLCSCLKHKGNRRRVSGMYEVMYGVHVEVCPLVACLLILHSATIRAFLFFFFLITNRLPCCTHTELAFLCFVKNAVLRNRSSLDVYTIAAQYLGTK